MIQDLTREIQKNNKAIQELLKINSQLTQQIEFYKEEDKECMSLATASRVYNLTYSNLYKKVKSGELKDYSTTSQIMVKKSDIEKCFFKDL